MIELDQNLINMRSSPRLQVTTILETDLTYESFQDFLGPSPNSSRIIGLSPGYTSAGNLTVLAVAIRTNILVIQFRAKSQKGSNAVVAARQMLQENLFANDNNVLFSFDMAPLAMALWYNTQLRVDNAVDIQDACTGCKDNRVHANAVEFSLKLTSYGPYRSNISDIFESMSWDPQKKPTTMSIALRAWLAGFLPILPEMEEVFRDARKINLKNRSDADLAQLSQWATGDRQLDSKKATATRHDFTSVSASQNKYTARGERFTNRIRATNNRVQVAVTDASGAQYTVLGGVDEVSGRNATIKIPGIMEGKQVHSLVTVGRDGPTMAEKDKSATLLRMLQQQSTASQSPFLKLIWPPADEGEIEWPSSMLTMSQTPPVTYEKSPLNDSQLKAVEHMLSLTNTSRFTIIQGPPGSGKTTVIAAYVQSAIAAGFDGIWLVAQSNVAVKNIAEKLFKCDFLNWRLLVSSDFHAGWHEHLYHAIESNIIRSHEFTAAAKELKDCQVILCTLSMLSNSRLDKFTRKVPIKTMVVDEASQINVNDYISLFEKFRTLSKMCFIGDDKQLPPYGQEEIQEIRSIFEVSHLRLDAIFLDIQYRMPPHTGEFISDHIYNGQLRSNPEHDVQELACWFVDVSSGLEKRNGTSWENATERQAILAMAGHLQEDQANYRIITPYDAQRSAIEAEMKEAGLHWQDKCFNVDSFQGNEEDVIIISLVRSHELGFLKDLRRTNVMLTRCKRSMFIFSSWDFLINGAGANSLVGNMATYCGDAAWLPVDKVEKGDFTYY